MANRFQSVWEHSTTIQVFGRNFIPSSNAGLRGTRLLTICHSTRSDESSGLADIRLSLLNLIKERANFFITFSGANSLYPLEIVRALERACFDNALRHYGANPGNVLKFGQ